MRGRATPLLRAPSRTRKRRKRRARPSSMSRSIQSLMISVGLSSTQIIARSFDSKTGCLSNAFTGTTRLRLTPRSTLANTANTLDMNSRSTQLPKESMMISTLRKFVGLKPRSYTLSVPRIEENEGLLLLGDPGTGKSQVIHQLLDNIAKRKPQEAAVVYDPAGEFIEKHYDPNSDIVLNPLDARCPQWMPCYEYGILGYEASAPLRQFIAESFFPYPDHLAPNTQFFIKAARSIFAQMLMFNPHPERIVEMLSEDDLIDYCVAGTEHAHLIDKDAKGQRGGVLATLSEKHGAAD